MIKDMRWKKYKLGELITQRREKYDGKETLCSWGVSRMALFVPNRKMQTPLYTMYSIVMTLYSILPEWN